MDTDPEPALEPARSLHEVFATLAGDPDPDAALAAAGHEGLPADLFTEAIVSYADTVPPEVAEHLAPVVLGASADSGLGLELLSSAPQLTWEDGDDGGLAEEPTWSDDSPALEDLDFGAGGHDALDGLDSPDAVDGPGHDVEDHVADVADHALPVHDAAVPDDVTDLPDDDLPHPDLAHEGWADVWQDGAGDATDDHPADDLPDA
jgi:hypothetical protein